MNSGEFTYGSPDYLNTDNDGYWNTDTSQYLWDSPQPEDSLQNYELEDNTLDFNPGPSSLANVTSVFGQDDAFAGIAQGSSAGATMRDPPQLLPGDSTAPSVTSEDSSHSSTSDRVKRETSSTSSPTGVSRVTTGNAMSMNQPNINIKMEHQYGDMDNTYRFEDSSLPHVGAGLDSLTLSNPGTTTHSPEFKFNTTNTDLMNGGMFGNHNMDTYMHMSNLRQMHSAGASPQMTIQPSKMFVIGEDNRENSPTAMDMMTSIDDPSSLLYNTQSAAGLTGDGYSSAMVSEPAMKKSNFGSSAGAGFSAVTPHSASHASHKVAGAQPTTQWPCKLTVESIPDKSRVETQIPIRLTLHNAPKNAMKLHLPSWTISKPKFQAKPPFQKSEDALELSCMLVCASAMSKEGARDMAFQRAAEEDIDVKSEDYKIPIPPAQMDENDPLRPLNGGPVAICQGCIVRERKRAARKKTKKADEEEEWAKDEARRVIVFNCPEVREWCVPGTKETSVKEHEGPVDQMFVHAPMRIACYCRHQTEKVGFQVIFTVRTTSGTILAQVMSESIMITDDHKQPTTGGVPQGNFASNMSSSGLYAHSQNLGMYPTFTQDMPFRTSWSTNDLRTLNQYAPQRRPANFQRQNSSSYTSTAASTAASTATATPRNLSRPASPTSPSGHSTKKRRSGIGSSHPKIPAGLTMTRMDDSASSSTAPTPMTAGIPSNFSFNSPTNFSASMNQSFNPMSMSTTDAYQSGPPTPMTGGMSSSMFGGNVAEPYEFWSAPTSQHVSRAPSPHSGTRQNSFSSVVVPQQAAFALSSLPSGLSLTRPPMIQRLIPNIGARSGGDEVTVLGSGFIQGLEVMFGDKQATNTTYWGDTTLVCRAPPAPQAGTVPVVFKHQHHSAPPEMQQLQGILPTRLVPYSYYEEDRQQMQALAMSLAAVQAQQQQQQQQQNQQQQQQPQAQAMSQEDLARAFTNHQAALAGMIGRGGLPGQQRRAGPAIQQQRQQGGASNRQSTSTSSTSTTGIPSTTVPPSAQV